ncbi:tailspike protein [Haloarcula tailed virus 3]|uniref:Tailspike protein n=1 Tax=Haloarcula tailed virus 3 TaxID=2877990 RepID=A0AAE8Y0S9_9CAUD|nr:tailspike protein [Haloarcula tailed virus 3]UBF23376.1 tailspike protein [Haloarcula tailed virus 3]
MTLNQTFNNWTIITDEPNEELVFEHNATGNRVTLHEDGQIDAPAVSTDQLSHDHVYNFRGDFGAVGDGTTDDTQAFLDATQQIIDDGGDVVLYLPSGTYLHTQSEEEGGALAFPDTANVTLMGDGAASVIKQGAESTTDDHGCKLIQPGPDCTIKDLKLDGGQQNNRPITDDFDGANILQAARGLTLQNVRSINSTGDGVEIFGKDARVLGCYFEDNYEQDVHCWRGETVIADNVMRGCLNDGAIRVFRSSDKPENTDPTNENLVIRDNLIVNPDTNGVELAVGADVTIENPTIKDNTIINPSENGIFASEITNNPEIVDNTVVGATQDGIKVDYFCDGAEIRDNVIRDCGRDGVRLSASNSRVVDNRIELSGRHGLAISEGGSDTLAEIDVVDNLVKNSSQNGNSKYGIFIDSNDNGIDALYIEDNRVISTTTPKQRNGIFIQSNTGAYSNVYIRDNDVSGSEFAEILLQETVTVVSGNEPVYQTDLSTYGSAPAGAEMWSDGTTGTAGPHRFDGSTWHGFAQASGSTVTP